MKWSPSCLQKDKGGFFIYTDFVQCILKKEWWAMYQVKNFTDSKNVKKIAQLGGFFRDRISARFKRFSRFGHDRLFLQPDECTETSAGMRNEQLTGHHTSRIYAVDARQRQRHNRY